MKVLLDTHELLWFQLDDPQLSAKARATILDPGVEKWVSPASCWEIAIKIGKGQYLLSKPFEDFMREAIDLNGFGCLHIATRHAALLTTMPPHHKDPFDRLLIAQAQSEGIGIVSVDARFDSYGVVRIW